MRRSSSGGIACPHSVQVVESDASTFSKLIFRRAGTGSFRGLLLLSILQEQDTDCQHPDAKVPEVGADDRADPACTEVGPLEL
jgi:hypothetical protein